MAAIVRVMVDVLIVWFLSFPVPVGRIVHSVALSSWCSGSAGSAYPCEPVSFGYRLPLESDSRILCFKFHVSCFKFPPSADTATLLRVSFFSRSFNPRKSAVRLFHLPSSVFRFPADQFPSRFGYWLLTIGHCFSFLLSFFPSFLLSFFPFRSCCRFAFPEQSVARIPFILPIDTIVEHG